MPSLKRDEGELYYEIAGSGPPVILIQGVGVVGGGWQPQINQLQARFSTVVLDNRGIGRSLPFSGPLTIGAMVGDIRALMDNLGWESAHMVGHSMGGVIAQQLALDCPNRVRSLSLLCTFTRGKDAARITPWIVKMVLRTRLGTRRMRRRAFLEMLYPFTHLEQQQEEELAAEVGRLIGRDLSEHPPILMRQLRALSRHDISTRLRELTGIPTLIASAEHDGIAPPRYGRALAAAIPGARFVFLADSSHGVTIHKATQINQLLERFLSEIEEKGSAIARRLDQYPKEN